MLSTTERENDNATDNLMKHYKNRKTMSENKIKKADL